MRHAGAIAHVRREYTQAREQLEQSFSLFERLEVRDGILRTLTEMARWPWSSVEIDKFDERRLALMAELGDQTGIASLLSGRVGSLLWRGELTRAAAMAEQALAVARESASRKAMLEALGNHARGSGAVLLAQGKYARAREVFEQKLSLSRQIGGRKKVAESLYLLGFVALCEGDSAAAKAPLEEALEAARANGVAFDIVISLHLLAIRAAFEDDLKRAAELMAECLEVVGERRDEMFGNVCQEAGSLACLRGDLAGARELLRESLEQGRWIYALANWGIVALLSADEAEAEKAARETLLLYRSGNIYHTAVLNLLRVFGLLSLRQNRREQAGRLLGAADAECEMPIPLFAFSPVYCLMNPFPQRAMSWAVARMHVNAAEQ